MAMHFSCTLYEGKGLNKKYNNLISECNLTTKEMLRNLEFLSSYIGAAELKIEPEPDIGVSRLSVEYDGDKYLFDLLEYKEDGSVSVRTQANFHGEPGLVYFSGELFPSSNVITDFEFIKMVFVEFLETGNVSYDLMNE